MICPEDTANLLRFCNQLSLIIFTIQKVKTSIDKNMNYKNLVLSWLILLFSPCLWAQSRQYISHELNGAKLNIESNEGSLGLQVYSPHIIEVSFVPKGAQAVDSSHVVRLLPDNQPLQLEESADKLLLKTAFLRVEVQKSPLKVKFYQNEKLLCQESVGFFANDSLQGFKFSLEDSEKLYGTGERALPLSRRGYRLELYNKAHYGYEDKSVLMGYNIPMVLSSKTYAIYFDNAPKGFIDLGKRKKDELSFESIGGRMTYYFVAAENFPQLLQHYTQLTGRQPLPPRWAFGNFASRYGYRSEAQVREVVKQFQEEGFPLDAIVLDHFWYGEGEIKKSVAMGDLDWYKPQFPNGEKLVKDLKAKQIETVLITQPFMLTNSKNYPETARKKLLGTDEKGEVFIIPEFYFGKTAILDIFNPATQDWFWQRYKKHIETGVHGWWGDLGEPEMHPSGIRHVSGKADDLHNVFGHYWAKMIAEGYQREYPNIRPFILMRAGFAGSQRFGLIPWSGDVSRTWGGLQSQPSLALNMSLCGLAYMHSDLGGFAGGEISPELYTRWLQYGTFQPIYRPHSQESVPAEVIYYADSTKQIVRKFMELRYQMLPYNYSLAYQNSTSGMPLMRPLFFAEPDNPNLQEESTHYLWGDALLVAPVVKPQQKRKEVYFPKGANWYDFWSDELYTGGSKENIPLSLDKIPVFVREGSFIPMLPKLLNTRDYTSAQLELHYFYHSKGEETEYLLYEDDGSNAQALEQEAYELLEFEAEQEKRYFEIEFEKEAGKSYPNAPQQRQIKLIIHGKVFTKVKGKKIDKKALRLSPNPDKKQTVVEFLWEKEEGSLRFK